jgi:hypothetical protein
MVIVSLIYEFEFVKLNLFQWLFNIFLQFMSEKYVSQLKFKYLSFHIEFLFLHVYLNFGKNALGCFNLFSYLITLSA